MGADLAMESQHIERLAAASNASVQHLTLIRRDVVDFGPRAYDYGIELRIYKDKNGKEEIQYWNRGMSVPFRGKNCFAMNEAKIKECFDSIQGIQGGTVDLRPLKAEGARITTGVLVRNVPADKHVYHGEIITPLHLRGK